MEFTIVRTLLWLQYPKSHPLLVQGECLFVLNCWPRSGWNDVKIGVIVVVFMCRIVVTVVIVGT